MSGAERGEGKRGRVVEMEWDRGLSAFLPLRVLRWCLCVQTVDGDRNGKTTVHGDVKENILLVFAPRISGTEG